MVALTVPPPSPASLLDREARTVKLALLVELRAGVNLSPALPWAKVMKSLLLMAVVPSL